MKPLNVLVDYENLDHGIRKCTPYNRSLRFYGGLASRLMVNFATFEPCSEDTLREFYRIVEDDK